MTEHYNLHGNFSQPRFVDFEAQIYVWFFRCRGPRPTVSSALAP